MKETTIKVRGFAGVASPFRQGGSLRLTLPKRIARIYGISRAGWEEAEEFVFFFIETDVGILMCSRQDVAHNKIMNELLVTP